MCNPLVNVIFVSGLVP